VSASSPPAEIELAQVLAVFGVRGELKLHLHHPESPLWAGPVDVVAAWPDGTRRPVRVQVRRGAGRRWLGRIDGLDDRDEARVWVGARLLVAADALPAPEPDELYVFQVEGAPVEVDGERVGTVVQVHHTGGNDVFEIRATDGRTEFVPSLRDHVETISANPARVVLKAAAWPGPGEEDAERREGPPEGRGRGTQR
jgi:16S rRNA processing protein RimM